jgi:hypothetical protein
MRRPADIALAERPQEVHEYRAALMSALLHTLPRSDPARLIVPSLQPLPLSQALELIHTLPERYQPKARAHAAFRLSVAIFVERREAEFGPYLLQLLGPQVERDLRARLRLLQEPTPELVFQAVYDSLGERLSPPVGQDDQAQSPSPDDKAQSPRRTLRTSSFSLEAAPAVPAQQTQSTLDLESLTTTVRIRAPSLRDFKDLRRVLDPRSWDESPFWPEAYQVELSPDRREFAKVKTVEVPGEPWHGHLFEHVEWNWNLQTLASFRNFLNISFNVSEAPQRIRLDFSLYACEGSQLLLREARNGIDVDRGFMNVDHVSTPQATFFRIDTQKAIRFSDILDRRTPFEGPVGSGQILSLLAPAVVGLWMHDLVSSLYFPRSSP